MGARNQTSILNLMKEGKNSGKLIVRCEQFLHSKFEYHMKWKATNLINTDSYFDFWDKVTHTSNYSKKRKDNTWIPAHKTEVIMNDLNSKWRDFTIDAYRLHCE